MNKTLLLFAALFSLNTFASTNSSTEACNELRVWRLRLALTASNLQNVNTTRTPEGGPYKPFAIKSCSEGGCVTERVNSPELRYLPDHPDANQNGYVAFPKIDAKAELTAMNVIARKLKSLALIRTCGSSVKEDGGIHYSADGKSPLEDDFIFNHEDRLVTWAEVDHLGKLTAIDLNAQGEVIHKR